MGLLKIGCDVGSLMRISTNEQGIGQIAGRDGEASPKTDILHKGINYFCMQAKAFPDLIRSQKLSRINTDQYLDGRSPRNTRVMTWK